MNSRDVQIEGLPASHPANKKKKKFETGGAPAAAMSENIVEPSVLSGPPVSAHGKTMPFDCRQ